uniref:WD_REPEATS_REGION domain-containing protein n=1 Tax=Globodera pallida TaxID=36090 RepID=A0A183CCB6_GLOPA
MVRRTDGPLSLDVRGTAFDVLPETDLLAVAGRNALTVVTIGISAPLSTSSWVQLRHNRNLVRLLKFNPLGTGCFATVVSIHDINVVSKLFWCQSGPFADIYTLGQGSTVQRLASLQAQSRKVADFCWCPFDEQLMMSCADGDSVSFWDLRTDLSRPSAQLGLLFGAGQAKFAPHLNNLVLSATGSDLRLWDLRHTSQPIVHFKGHQSRVLCLDWHPHHQEPNSFFTSANDGALKLWCFGEQRSEPSLLNVAPISAWRLVFSQEGQELAALSLSTPHTVALFFNYGLDNIRQLKGIERDDTLMDAAWHKSTSALKSTTKFLYTLSKKRRLCRHAIAYELSNEIRDEMSTPIMQSAVDEERDRLVAAAATVDECHKRTEALDIGGGAGPFPRHSVGSVQSSGNAALGSLPTLKSLIGSLKAEGGGGTSDGGHKTPQSPIYSDWHRWIRAPNVLGGDLLTELEALRKHSTEGLYTTEVNFQRAAIGFSYMHQNQSRKICWEMRFHREFIENGLNESPLTPDKACLFLTLLQQECDEQVHMPSTQTVLCLVFHQLPKIVDLMKIFALPIGVPSDGVSLSKASSQSGSAGEDSELAVSTQQQLTMSTVIDLGLPLKKQSLVTVASTVLFPVTFTPSLSDHRVPAPRYCGARFNRSGYLVTFGRTTNATATTTTTKLLQQPGDNQQQHRKIVNCAKSAEHSQRREGNGGGTLVDASQTAPFASRLTSRKTSVATAKINAPNTIRNGERATGNEMNPSHAFPPAASILRQSSAMAASTSAIPVTQFQCSPPVRCVSPHRPTSPWTRQTGDSSTNAEPSQEGGSSGREPNSLSPPSLLKQQNLLLSGTGRILGSSPNSTSLTAINPRTFSLYQQQNQQSPAFQAIMRQRVATMSAVAEGVLTPANAHPPPIQHQMSAMAELSGGTKSLLGWPTAVMPEQSFTSTVYVYDAVSLLPISQELARSYKLIGTSPLAICRHNREQAARKGRRDLLTVWRLLEQCVGSSVSTTEKKFEQFPDGISSERTAGVFARAFRLRPDETARALISSAKRADAPWAIHPLGRGLINRLLEHYVSRHDLQTAAVIICVLNGVNADGRMASKEKRTNGRHVFGAQQRQKFAGEQSQRTESLSNGPTIAGQTEQAGGLFFAMDQSDSSGAKVPPAPPAPPLLPSQQLQLPPSRKTSAALGAGGTCLATVIPSLSFVSGWSRQSSEPNAATVLNSAVAPPFYSARLVSETLHTSATAERLSPAHEFATPYQRSATMEVTSTAAPLLTDGRAKEDTAQQSGENELLLDPTLCPRLEELKRRYADILYRWRMYRKCAEVLKHCSRGEGDEASVGTIPAICWCSHCGQQQTAGSKCTKCRRPPIYCAICEQPCRGIVVTCSVCSHGGHFTHLTAWFNAQSQCPLGCGCECRF